MSDQTSSTELNSRITAFFENLIASTSEAAKSEAVTNYLASMSAFHNYSWNNTMLIWMHKPDASQVAGYKTWQKLGRQVRKGEKGIPILAPVSYRQKDSEGEPTGEAKLFFKTVYVFDVSQTDGEPLPEAPNWKSTEKRAELESKLIDFATGRSITVTVSSDERSDGAQGVSMGGTIELAPAAGTKTLIHELAHEMLHQATGAKLYASHELMELQAESVAYVVSKHFGMEPEGSPNYLALWGADPKDMRAHFATIQKCAAEIITAVEGKADKVTE
jgi:antirestriction protein ArdC